MTSRFTLAAALGLALATGFAGFAGIASAQPSESSKPASASATSQPAPAKTFAKAAAKTSAKTSTKPAAIAPPKMTLAHKAHRIHVAHRAAKHARLAQHLSRHARPTHQAVALRAPTKSAKAGFVRRHVAKAKSVFARHAMNRAARTTVIR